MHRRTFLTAAAATALTAAAPVPALAATGPRISTAFTLPDEHAYPEGIALDPRTGDAYVGSYTTGAVYRAAAKSRAAEVFLPAGTDGRTTANGLKADRAGRLWVIDSTTGIDVYDLRDRSLLARFEVPEDDPRFVNDLVITADGTAYATDSVRPLVYRVTPAELLRARGGGAPLTARYDLSRLLPPHQPGTFALNGIAADRSGRLLFVVDMTGGGLYRIDSVTGSMRQVALHGGDLVHGDGLELAHGTLWVAHNASNTLTHWHLSHDGTTARLRRRFTDPALQIPTTLAHDHHGLLVVRSQFDKGGPMGQGTPRTPFTVARVKGM
ncbi:superoxide dismutase [Streptomyces pluripotens]|uniref:Superoxide dismutase n=2 Tax=Streptomyces TaxID=1883 RepID=A0A221P2D3_9ACTN|nr:superoxide dismutase [Streptomyces pluripotens]ASN26370.1 superoxide dismutase [Streptomyces pluripotens]KIE22924.1 superoxide dismutase [Streptomyces sp. MUSC 125]MCH0555978.1 SMP-30/gluconolactonase/LRE family protein [Streptomyces sp. MUM 16J]